MSWKNGLGVALVFLASAGCGSPGAAGGEAARPDDPTANDALGDKGTPGSADCTRVSPQAAPFLADWKTDQRAELAATMQDGVAVLSYSCQGIKVLSDCKLDGEYRFAEVAIKKEDIEIDQSSDLSATLPVAAIEISAEVQRGLKLRLAYAMIGRNTTATGDSGEVGKSELKPKSKGACDGATHYVRWAWMGAFDFGTATEGSVAGGVKVMGAGAEGSSKSARKLGRSDGDRGSCKPSGSEKPAEKAPSGCDAIVQLQLGPVVAEKTASAAEGPQSGPGEKATNPCSDGFVLTADGSCKKKSGAGAYLCDSKNVDECKTQCDKGSAESCHSAALAQYRKDAHANYQEAQEAALPFYEKACDKNYYRSCGRLADAHSFGKAADPAKARGLHQKACSGGESSSCLSLASLAERAPFGPDAGKFQPNPTLAFGYTKKACELGSSYACSLLAKRYIEGKGVMANMDEGLKTLDRSCQKRNYSACTERARFFVSGDAGAKKDPTKGLELYAAACEKNNYGPACIGGGDLLRDGSGAVKKDPEKARKFFSHACENLHFGKACVSLANMYEGGHGGDKDVGRALKLYQGACPIDAPGSRDGCYGAATLLEKGGAGVTKDAKLAATYYAKGCMPDMDKTGTPEKSCKKATTLLAAQKRDSELRGPTMTLCGFYKDKGACDKMKKLAPPGPPKGPPGPPKGRPGPPKGPPPPPPPPPTKK